jgi:hypothetical protein
VSWLRPLRNAARLPATERGLAVRAVVTLLTVRVALAWLPFRVVRRFVDSVSGARPRRGNAIDATAVRTAVARATRVVAGSRCLPQALTAEILLRRAGRPARTSIGVAPDGAPLDAHAWVHSDALLVTGDVDDLGKYRTLVVFGGETPSTGGR